MHDHDPIQNSKKKREKIINIKHKCRSGLGQNAIVY